MSLFRYGNTFDPVAFIFILVIANIALPFISLYYFGYSFNSEKELENNETKKTLIQISYINLTFAIIVFIALLIYLLVSAKDVKK